jgi:hypothetical protein
VTSLQARPITARDYQAWFNRHADCLYNRTPFHQPAWLGVVHRASRCRVAFLGLWQGAEMTCTLPIFLARRGPLRLAGSPLRGAMTSYLGPIALDRAILEDALPGVLTLCRDAIRTHWRVDYLEVILRDTPRSAAGMQDNSSSWAEGHAVPASPANPYGQQPSPGPSIGHNGDMRAGWTARRPPSYRLDLRAGPDALWSAMKGRARRSIRQAQRAGITIVPLRDATIYFQLHQQTFARRGLSAPHPLPFFQAIFDRLEHDDIVWVEAALCDDSILSAGIFLHDDRETLYISGASPAQPGTLSAGHLLHWHIIQRAASAGQGWYDFVGRGVASIDHFKESFSPEMVEYWSVSWAPWPVRIAETGVALARPALARARQIVGAR